MDSLIDRISNLETRTFKGRVSAVNGLLVEAEGPAMALTLGARAHLDGPVKASFEVVGFRGETALMMAYDDLTGVRPGAIATLDPRGDAIRPHKAWLGRVMDSFCRPQDSLASCPRAMWNTPSKAARRAPIAASVWANASIWACAP